MDGYLYLSQTDCTIYYDYNIDIVSFSHTFLVLIFDLEMFRNVSMRITSYLLQQMTVIQSKLFFSFLFFFVPLYQFRMCMLSMLGMGGGEEETSTSQSVTEVSKVGPA